MTFRYQKLYADLVSQEGTVCIVYATRLCFLGFEQRSAGYELYGSNGERSVVHASGPADVRTNPEAGLEVHFPTRAGLFSLRFEPTGRAPCAEQRPADGLSWQVMVLASAAEVRGLLGTREPLVGCGYSDRVRLERVPRRLGLRRIQWGRAHLQERGMTRATREALAFTRVTLASGEVWQCSLDTQGISSELALETRNGELIRVRAQTGSEITISDHRCLHRGAALDAARFPAPWERRVTRALSGPMSEIRSLSRARRSSGAEGWILHEDVQILSRIHRSDD